MYNYTDNICLMADSYKLSQWVQYPKNTTKIFSYIESRGGAYDKTVFFGLQMFIKRYLLKPVTKADVDEAAVFAEAHGMPFNKDGWMYIVDELDGKLPVEIQAVPEGTVVQTKNILVSVVNTDDKCFWLTSYLETALLRAVWYPTTVATVSAHARSIIKKYLDLTSENPEEELPFKLHDFGARGVSSPESASIGGAAHLAAGAMGSDTIEGVIAASRFYNAPVSAFSIPASEHSTITSWMRSGESDAYENMVMQFSGEGRIYACVSDSYDIFEAIDMWAEKRDLIESKGGTLVIRPDSGDPVETPVSCVVRLAELFGTYKNSKGFLVLNDSVRVIQGDGITASSISEILEKLYDLGFSASNIAFGMGGGLLQHCDRDTLKFAMKCSAAEVDGVWRDVYKDPITDKGKKSKKGIISLFVNPDNEYRTLRVEEANYVTLGEPYVNCLNTVYKNGILTLDFDLEQVRSNSSNF